MIPLKFQIVSLPETQIVRTKQLIYVHTYFVTDLVFIYLIFFLYFKGAPTIDVATQDIVVVEGEKMDIKIPYRAIPKPSMVWKKGDTELKTEDRLTLTCELNRVHLELLKCKHEDAGMYTVTLENSLGSVTGTVNVTVIGKRPCNYMT